MSILKNRLGNFLVNVTVLLAAFFALAVAVSIVQPAVAGIVRVFKGQVAFPLSGIIINGTTMAASATQLDYTIVTPGAVTASKALVVDSSSQIGLIDVSAQGGLKVQGSKIVIPVQFFVSGAIGNDTGVTSDGVLIGQITKSNVICFQDDGGSFTDDTTDCNDAGSSDVAMFPADPLANDAFYIGHATKQFSYIFIDIGTSGTTDLTVAWEYYDGTDFSSTLPFNAAGNNGGQYVIDFDESNGEYFNVFEPPSDWALTTVNSQEAYWVRVRVVAYTSSGTDALADRILIGHSAGDGFTMPTAGRIVAVSFTAETVSATNADSSFLIINQTASTTALVYTLATFTQAEAYHRHDVTDLVIAAGDEIVIQQILEDGSTEFSDFGINLEFEL